MITPLFGRINFKTNYNYRLSNHCFINELILVTYALIRNAVENIYDEVTGDIFDMSNVRIFKEIENNTMWDIYTLLCLWSAELSKTFGLRTLCYSKIYVVMLLAYRIAGISQKLESKQKNIPCAQMLHV